MDKPSIHHVKEKKPVMQEFRVHYSIHMRCPESVPVATWTWQAWEKYKVTGTGHGFLFGVMKIFVMYISDPYTTASMLKQSGLPLRCLRITFQGWFDRFFFLGLFLRVQRETETE